MGVPERMWWRLGRSDSGTHRGTGRALTGADGRARARGHAVAIPFALPFADIEPEPGAHGGT